jgi:hypothetical protein
MMSSMPIDWSNLIGLVPHANSTALPIQQGAPPSKGSEEVRRTFSDSPERSRSTTAQSRNAACQRAMSKSRRSNILSLSGSGFHLSDHSISNRRSIDRPAAVA